MIAYEVVYVQVIFFFPGPTTPAPIGPPEAPARLDFSEVTANSVTLTWDSISDAAYYVVKYSSPDTQDVFSDIAFTNEWRAIGLNPEASYSFEVTAVNEHGNSEPSQIVTVVTLGVPG